MLSGPTQFKLSERASPDKYFKLLLLPHFWWKLDCCVLDVLCDDVMVSHIDWAPTAKWSVSKSVVEIYWKRKIRIEYQFMIETHHSKLNEGSRDDLWTKSCFEILLVIVFGPNLAEKTCHFIYSTHINASITVLVETIISWIKTKRQCMPICTNIRANQESHISVQWPL